MTIGPQGGENPYQPPLAPLEVQPQPLEAPDAVQLRRQFGKREAAIGSLGILAYLTAAIFAILVINSVRYVAPMAINPGKNPPDFVRRFVDRGLMFEGIGIGVAAFFGFVGRGLRRQQRWSRWAVIVLAGAGLASLIRSMVTSPWRRFLSNGVDEGRIVELISCCCLLGVLFLVCSFRGRMVFSASYRAAVAATPEITGKMGWPIKIAVGIATLFGIILLLTGVTHSADRIGR